MANIIRIISFNMGTDRVRFTFQTDLNELDTRRVRLYEIINEGYTRDDFIELGEYCYSVMKDRNFLFCNNLSDNNNDLQSFLIQNRGEITLTKEWMDVHSFDIYLNCIFMPLA